MQEAASPLQIAPGRRISPEAKLPIPKTFSVKIGISCSVPKRIMKAKIPTRVIKRKDEYLKIWTFNIGLVRWS